MNVALVDIGTNSIHMLIIRVDPDLKFHVIDRAKEMANLGREIRVRGGSRAHRRGVHILLGVPA